MTGGAITGSTFTSLNGATATVMYNSKILIGKGMGEGSTSPSGTEFGAAIASAELYKAP